MPCHGTGISVLADTIAEDGAFVFQTRFFFVNFLPVSRFCRPPLGRNEWKEFMSFAEEVKKTEKVSGQVVQSRLRVLVAVPFFCFL